jgi:predicted glycoside hydrolase/deacetylase ChbG (UPF0249 family)
VNVAKLLIVNADDFGASAGINRGIVDCHVRGVVTSTSMLIDGAAADEAAELARQNPRLSVGLHWNIGEGDGAVDTADHAAIRAEWDRQLARFAALLGQPPTHVDSHWHVHAREDLLPLFRELTAPLGVPLRGDGGVAWIGGFYGQWEWKVTDLEHVSVEFLEQVLREEVGPGWTEIACHPGYVEAGDDDVYLREREAELATLTDPRVRDAIERLGIRLASYADYRGGNTIEQP